MPVLPTTPYTRAVAEPYIGRPWTPKGQLVLREALMRFGGAHFGDEWTGKELSARHTIFGPPRPPEEPESNTIVQVKRDGKTKQIYRPVRYATADRLLIISYDEALKRYEDEKEELFELWQNETSAFQRYLQACGLFRQVLHAGQVPAFTLTNHGNIEPVPKSLWAGSGANRVFDTGTARFSTSGSYSPITIEGIVLVPSDKLDAYLRPTPNDTFQPKPQENEVPVREANTTNPAPATPSIKASSAGRPAKWDWEALWVQACKRIYLDGIPKTQAELVRELQTWFVEEYGDTPSDSQIKERVSKLLRALREAENS